MFRHLALFRWTADTTAAEIGAITAALRACAESLDVVTEFRCGPDIRAASGPSGEPTRFDYAVVATFADRAAWAIYDADPEHARIRRELIVPRLAERIVTQFED